MKICPFCDGELRDDAIKCWHCTMTLPPVKVAKQNISEQKVPPREVSKITKEPPPRPSPQQSAVSTPHIEEKKVKAETLSRPSPQQSAVSTPHIEEKKVKAETLSRRSPQQRAVGKPHIEENNLKAKTLDKAVIISVSIIIVLAGILFTIANLNKIKELVSVATPKVEAPVVQPAPAPAPVPVRSTNWSNLK